MSVLNFLLKNLQGCCLLFNYQGSFSLLSSQRQLIYIITFTIACQQLFYFSFSLSASIISVVRNSSYIISIWFVFVKHFFYFVLKFFSFLVVCVSTATFISYLIGRLSCLSSGEGGIRTHAPLRTNGFQDRLVMTTSIPLLKRALLF